MPVMPENALMEEQILPEEAWDQFFSSPCWKEFLNTMKSRLAIAHQELEVCSPEDCPSLQAAIKEDRFILAFQSIIEAEFAQISNEEVEHDGQPY